MRDKPVLFYHTRFIWKFCYNRICWFWLIWRHPLDPYWTPCRFAYRANRSEDDAVNMGLHFTLQHPDRPGTYVRILFVDFSSTFNTIIPDTLQNKLTELSVPTSICQWIRQSSWQTGSRSWGWENTHPAPVRSALELLRAVFSPHCSSLSTRTTAQLKTPPSSSWSVQITPHWLASFRCLQTGGYGAGCLVQS